MRVSNLLVLLVLASSGVVAQPSQQSLVLAKTVPIADVHMHTYKHNGPQAKEFLEQMDANGVVWGGAVGDYREDVAQLLGKRYISAVGQAEFMQVFFSQGEAGLIDENHPVFVRFYEEADRLLAAGKAKGFGELHTDNHNSGPKNIQRHIRTDNKVMRRFYEIASKHNGFVQIHSQLDDDFVEDVLRLTADFPRVLTVLSHCLPLSRPSDLENLFSQRSNLVCELSAQGYIHNKLAGIKRAPRVHTEDGIKDGWKRLIEKFPDRVMVGTDACCGWFGSYSDMVKEIRNNLLPSLEPEVMEKVAYKNAVRLFKLSSP